MNTITKHIKRIRVFDERIPIFLGLMLPTFAITELIGKIQKKIKEYELFCLKKDVVGLQ
jgi:hypothetical protein